MVTVKKKKTIHYNFSQKHKDYIKRTSENMFNFAEGAVRAGKTVDHVYAFAHELKSTKDKFHLATGSTEANAKLNIGDCNGYGLEYYFRGQCRWGKYKGNECLIIKGHSTGYKERVVIFAGGAKADSFKKIRGNSYGMWIATEINLHHDMTIKEAFNRTIAADKRKIFWDLNPDNPNSFIYKDYIDNYDQKNKEGTLLGGYNYEHFTIDDNINIPDERKELIKSQYDKESIWYKRDILGQRCIAEGLIYRIFANEMNDKERKEKRFVLSKDKLPRFQELNIGVDFGGSGSGHAFTLTGITPAYKQLVTLSSERWLEGTNCNEVDSDKLGQLLVDFVKRTKETYGHLGNVEHIYCDSAEQVLIRSLKAALQKAGIYITVRNAMKSEINDRIRCVQILMQQGRFFVTEDCKTLIEALNTAIWNPKNIVNDERLDDGSSDVDSLDSFEYTFEKSMKRLMDANNYS
jgi:PBSX family phage terminase large subunit